ncbi:AAA family ATPase [Empedobacter falsenii]
MITKITLYKIASYKNPTNLETDKKINLIYGLNGTGKSTFSKFLNNHQHQDYQHCELEGLTEMHEFLVYNQEFIQDNFYEADNLKGIFSLSRENKEAETKIEKAKEEINKLETTKAANQLNLTTIGQEKQDNITDIKDEIWKIKTEYSGGERIFEFCLEGYRNSKDVLYRHLNGLEKPTLKPVKNLEVLKQELESISGDNAQKYDTINQISFNASSIEKDTIFSKQIIGNENSSVSALIQELKNSDWVKAGLSYLPEEKRDENTQCPFCQEHTISTTLIENIKDYFDEAYEKDIRQLNYFKNTYSNAINALPDKSIIESNPKYNSFRSEFESKYNSFITLVNRNLRNIESKINTPSVSIELENSEDVLNELNEVITQINIQIQEHNTNIDEIENVKLRIKTDFWDNMRWDYDPFLSAAESNDKRIQSDLDAINSTLRDLEQNIRDQYQIITTEQKNTVNIDDAIANIKNGLIDLGITDFEIIKHEENLYKIKRGDVDSKVFQTLSEGEKMIISFLYFIELCRGKKDAAELDKKKIIVIDDPISSLSHIHVFNIGRLIKSEFFAIKKKKKNPETKKEETVWEYNYEQVFILTHSLYFFYELTETNHVVRKDIQKLYRIIKNENGSSIVKLTYEEIQNDYQAYWYIVKDKSQHPALIANCMRNIIEYFFNFVEKQDLNNFFLQDTFKSHTRYQAFYRYINRESHSIGQNVMDFKEFNYDDFRDAFKALFEIAGYEDHYKKMIKE